MSQSKPTLSQLRKSSPQDLAHCEGYVWHLGTKIGKGSFGEVFLGWSNDGSKEVAVKVVRKEYFKQDPKVRENLEREIRILKLLRACESVVQLYHVQELRQYIVLVMELCDYDLDHLVKVDPFIEENIIVFLYQLAQGMKALRNQNIVHRDLKPGNILIKRHNKTGKMMIKLADFGFARHFKDEGNKSIDMTSLAGTPVFMAPEALSCVFHPGEHYDDKVDIWSIGALLYKVIVGQCGFYAQLQDIPRILRHKGDAIAFERATNRKINYIYELPSSVNDRLSGSFREKMKSLLCSMLKLDPRERMTFTEFFETVDDIIRSKVEIINLLYGASFKVISDPSLTSDVLIDKVHLQWKIPSTGQVIFSKSCSHYIAPNEIISHDQFVELLEKSGGSKGHAKLYLLPVRLVQEADVSPDMMCMAGLKNCLDDASTLITMVKDDKYAEEIVHMLSVLGAQFRKQQEGLEELACFSEQELGVFRTTVYPSLMEQAHQSLAKLTLAAQWLETDMAFFHSKNADTAALMNLLSVLQGHQSQLGQSLVEMREFTDLGSPSMESSLTSDNINTFVSRLTEQAKKLSKAPHTSIQSLCRAIFTDCEKEISSVTAGIKAQLTPVTQLLLKLWTLRSKSSSLLEVCSSVELHLQQASQERNRLLSTVPMGVVRDGKSYATPPAHASSPAMTPPPGGWPGVGVGMPGPTQPWADPVATEKMKKELEVLKVQLVQRDEQTRTLQAQLESLKISTGDVESTIVASETRHLSSSSSSGELSDVMATLVVQLKQFCTVAVSSSGASPTKAASGASLYPMLNEYSVIKMPSEPEEQELSKLLPLAQDLVTKIKSSQQQPQPHQPVAPIKETSNSALAKIARPTEYVRGDIVMFTAVRMKKSKSTLAALLHLQQNKPFMLLDNSVYVNFNIRPGKVPDIFLAKLSQNPVRKTFAENPALAQEMGQDESAEFYFVKAEPISAKFSAARSGSTSQVGGATGESKPPRPLSVPRKFLHKASGKGRDYV